MRTINSATDYRDEFYMAHRVMFSYYVGRKAMFDAEYHKAEENLSFAFEHCLAASQKNKRAILVYLVPVKLLLGKLPTARLLAKYQLEQFSQVTEAVRTGNLLLLREALATHQAYFVQCGIYLILEKLRVIAYRNLFKKVYSILGGQSQIKLDALKVAMTLVRVSSSLSLLLLSVCLTLCFNCVAPHVLTPPLPGSRC